MYSHKRAYNLDGVSRLVSMASLMGFSTLSKPEFPRNVVYRDKETSILKYLYRQGPKTITRDVLLKEVWGYNNRVTTHTLETHIYRLRQKIERDPSNARLLVTEEGGYRLVP